MIELDNVSFSYPGGEQVFHSVTFTVSAGSHVALMGRNGAGKSTLARIVKGMLPASSGRVRVDGIEAEDDDSRYELMRRTGLVFQNPDDTIVATTVERELAFGLENIGVPRHEMIERVTETLHRFDLERYRHANPSHLSGGEKQRLALAAVMVMEPSHLILDEPTSLLDPWSRGHILNYIHDTARRGTTVIHITQFASEARQADRVIVLDSNGVCHDCAGESFEGYGADTVPLRVKQRAAGSGRTNALTLSGVGHVYEKGTPFEHEALTDVSFAFSEGSATALLGPTGSGKTTLLEIASGVTQPTSGAVKAAPDVVRGMAFQFPEDQMFGDTVASYIAFGPSNIGVARDRISGVVDEALLEVGLSPEEFRDRDPLTLSGGEKRRAALAGVLAMKPGILVLDEPFAGLDREGTALVMEILDRYICAGGTLLFSTHDFEVARHLADTAVFLKERRVVSAGPADEIIDALEKTLL